jgi:hypothetical protein
MERGKFAVFALTGLSIMLCIQDLKGQVFQDDGVFKGKVTSIDECMHQIPFKNQFALKSGDPAAASGGAMGANVNAYFQNVVSQTQPNAIRRDLEIKLNYQNTDYGSPPNICGSHSQFADLVYLTRFILPALKPNWLFSISMNYTGNSLYNKETVFLIEIKDLNTDSTYSTSDTLMCDPISHFADQTSSVIRNLKPGVYSLSIEMPDWSCVHLRTYPNNMKGDLDLNLSMLIAGF